MSTLVITGASGHIGSYLLRHWDFSRWSRVRCVDNLSTGRLASYFHLPAAVLWELVETDICTADWKTLLTGVDTVFHLAALTDAESSVARRKDVLRINHDATVRLAEACTAAGVRLWFPSTTSVYGPQSDTVDETCPDSQLNPQSPYAESKLRAERALQALAAKGLQCWITRLGTIFGAATGMRFHTAVNKFFWQARWGRPLTIWRTAFDQVRPYLGLRDCAAAARTLCTHVPADGAIYNVVTANYTVRDIVTALRQHYPDLATTLVDSPIMNQHSYHVRSDRLRRHGWTPDSSITEGLAEMAALLP